MAAIRDTSSVKTQRRASKTRTASRINKISGITPSPVWLARRSTRDLAYYGPFGDIADTVACEDQFRNAYLLGCVGAWSLHPVQIDIAKKVFSPEPSEVAWAMRVIEEMGDGTGAVMIDGKMQDDATVKQCHVVVNLARELAAKDPDLATSYGF